MLVLSPVVLGLGSVPFNLTGQTHATSSCDDTASYDEINDCLNSIDVTNPSEALSLLWAIDDLIRGIVEDLRMVLQYVPEANGYGPHAVLADIIQTLDTVADKIQQVSDTLRTYVETVQGTIQKLMSVPQEISSFLNETTQRVIGGIWSVFEGIAGPIKGITNGLIESMQGVSEFMDGLVDWVNKAFGN